METFNAKAVALGTVIDLIQGSLENGHVVETNATLRREDRLAVVAEVEIILKKLCKEESAARKSHG